jgi:formylglycine-generating enzyme required for sulfatase activity
MTLLQPGSHDTAGSLDDPPRAGMLWIPGGTFAMGSNDHYPEEAPVHRVTVDGFWMDAAPVTTVETHRALALRKLNLDTTAALIRYAIRNKLVED